MAKMTIPLAVAAPVAYVGVDLLPDLLFGTGDQKELAIQRLTGYSMYNKKFVIHQLIPTYMPIAAGIVIHKLANLSGLNALLGRSKIPLIRV